jgi:hypothetical protein
MQDSQQQPTYKKGSRKMQDYSYSGLAIFVPLVGGGS